MVEKYEGRCMKCRKQVEIFEPTIVVNKKGMNMVSGTCEVCKTKVFRILGKPKN